MSNINLGQFLNNFSNNFNQVNTNNVQNNMLQQTQLPQQSQDATLLQQFLPQTAAQLSQTAAELAVLNQQQTVNMLKELMQFPKNMEQLLNQLINNMDEGARQNALKLLSSSLNTSQLAVLMQNNSKEAMTNLYQMLAQFNQIGASVNTEQTAELAKLISFVSASATSDVQSLKTTMLMYLPWLPLTDPEAFKLEFGSNNLEDGSVGEDSVTLLISTENYGNLKSVIYKTEKDGIKIDFTSSETFPQNEFTVLMREESKKYNVNINLEYVKKEVFNKKKNEQSKTQIYMNTSPGVNLFLLLVSNAVIKNVHEIDSKENLRQHRKEKIDNDKGQN